MGFAEDSVARGQVPRYGLVVACYGSADPAFFERVATPLAQEMRAALAARRGVAPEGVAYRIAYTSPRTRAALAARGVSVADVAGALDGLARAGVREVAVASLHVVSGESYRAAMEEASQAASRFCAVHVAAPLLADADDAACLARALADRYPSVPGRAVVLVGHGAVGAAQLSYAALQTYLAVQGRNDLLVGTLRGRPGVEEVTVELAACGCRCVLLAPLMLAAGVHAVRDIVGAGEDSWRSRFTAAGVTVEVAPDGLAALPVVRELAVRHVLAAVPDGAPEGAAAPQSQRQLDNEAEIAGSSSLPAEVGANLGVRSQPEEPDVSAVVPPLFAGMGMGSDALPRSAEADTSPEASPQVAAAGALPEAQSEGSARPPRFPLFISLAGARCLVAGCGAVGERRARVLARFGAEVLVVDPRGAASADTETDAPPAFDTADDAERMAKGLRDAHVAEGAPRDPATCGADDASPRPVLSASGGYITIAARAYQEGDETGSALVVAATNNRAVNRRIGERCRERGIPVSVADAPAESTFFFPALCEGERLVAGIVSRDGAHADHALVARAARDVRSILP